MGKQYLNGIVYGGVGQVTDVQVDGVSVVTNGVAEIDLTDYAQISDLGTASAKDYTSSVTQGSADLVTSGAVFNAIDNLPEPMVFKGTLGTGGTITTLPTASASNEGYTYKVITAGTYAGQAAKVGDVFVSNGTEWVLIPAGDTDSDTWRAINVNGTEAIGSAISTGAVNFKNGNNVTITSSGNDITISATDTTYSDATQSTHGLMSTSDKTKLDGIAAGAEVNVQSDWSQSDSTADDYIKNKPTIPTVNDGTLTITQNGTSKGTFTANQSANATIALTDTTGYINQNETVLATDKVPYVMRKAKNIANSTPYIRETLVGGTIGWNQILQNGNFASTSGWTSYAGLLYASGNILTETKASGTTSNTIGIYRADIGGYIAGHKYIVMCDIKSSAALSNTIYISASNQSITAKGGTLSTSWNTFYNVFNLASYANNYINLFITGMSSYSTELVLNFKNFMLIDLTLMFGDTIANYIYSIETATAGSGYAKLKEWGFLSKSYYEYSVGSLQSVQTSGHKVTGFNQWDEQWEVGGLYWANGQPDDSTTTRIRSKNYCDIIGGIEYYKRNGSTVYIFLYDDNKNLIEYTYENTFTTPANARYFKILNVSSSEYNNDICFNISDSTKNGTYEPYRTNTYNVDDVVLRGIPKLDANNLLYYDGDTYSSDGHVIVKYSYVDLGSLDWYAGTAGGFQANISGLKEGLCGLRAAKYRYDETTSFSWANFSTLADKTIYRNSGSGNYTIYVKDTAYSDAASFTTAMNGVLLVYEKSTQSDTTWHPFDNPQYVYPGGTEEYIDTREIPVPVGHITEYMGASDGKFYLPPLPIDDAEYVLSAKNGIILWKRVTEE